MKLPRFRLCYHLHAAWSVYSTTARQALHIWRDSEHESRPERRRHNV